MGWKEEYANLVIILIQKLINNKEGAMRKAKKTGKVTYIGVTTKNIPNNFRGKEDIFWAKVKRGMKKFLESPFK